MQISSPTVRRCVAWTPALLVTFVGLALLWPIPAGNMPLSWDHPIHLTRIWMVSEELSAGAIRGWSPIWFAGTPVGELYPVLCDLGVLLVRGLSLGMLSLEQAYAIAFSLAFVGCGWALLRAGRALELGPVPGLVAALLMLSDVGAYREGGWIYTVDYGVWLQPLATCLCWLGFAELVRAIRGTPLARRRYLALATLSLGASLLVHPMSLLMIAIGAPLLVAALPGLAQAELRGRAMVHAGLAIVGAVSLAAWWLLPMLGNRAWMASYGWLFLSLDTLLSLALRGAFAQGMPAPVGVTIWLGLLIATVVGSRQTRFFAAFAVVLWIFSSIEMMWWFRLDLLSEGFTHIQYQRFIIASKPGLFLLAGVGLSEVFRIGWRRWTATAEGERRTPAVLVWVAGGLLAASLVAAQHTQIREAGAGKPQFTRVADGARFDRDYAAVSRWLAEQWSASEQLYRICYITDPEGHWYMDTSVRTGIPVYKLGFTPGNNFVHKPASSHPQVLDTLRVRYVIGAVQQAPAGTTEVARFGAMGIFERPSWDRPLARLDGTGTVQVLEENLERGVVRLQVEGTDGPTPLVVGVAGHPRWEMSANGQTLPWREVPILGDGPAATPEQRRAGALRGGKATGADGTEPTLMAADVQDGEIELVYRRWRGRDVLGVLVSVVGLLLVGALLWRPARFGPPTAWLQTLETRLGFLGRPLVVGGLLLAAVAVAVPRWMHGSGEEAPHAFGWIRDGRAVDVERMEARPFKVDMLIVPAVTVTGSGESATATWPGVHLGETLDGWIGLDDDFAKAASQGGHLVNIEVRATGEQSWTSLMRSPFPHRPGRATFQLPTGPMAGRTADVRVQVLSKGEKPSAIAFDLELGE